MDWPGVAVSRGGHTEPASAVTAGPFVLGKTRECPRSATMCPSWSPPPRQHRVSGQEEAGDQPVRTPQAATAPPAAPSRGDGPCPGRATGHGKGRYSLSSPGQGMPGCSGLLGKTAEREDTHQRPATCPEHEACGWAAGVLRAEPHAQDPLLGGARRDISMGPRGLCGTPEWQGCGGQGVGGGAGRAPACHRPLKARGPGFSPLRTLRTGLTAKRSPAHPRLPWEIVEPDACEVLKLKPMTS